MIMVNIMDPDWIMVVFIISDYYCWWSTSMMILVYDVVIPFCKKENAGCERVIIWLV